jgi:hypothetical protein
MAINKERSILTTTEIEQRYSPPVFSDEDQWFFFTLSDQEQENAARSRSRQKRCMFVLLLGYFKCKPVVLKPQYYTIKNDLQYIAAHVFPGKQYGVQCSDLLQLVAIKCPIGAL